MVFVGEPVDVGISALTTLVSFDERNSMFARYAQIGCCAGAVMGLVACSASASTAAKDVAVTGCNASPTGDHPTATGTVTNHSSKSSGYTIHVKFADASGNAVGDGVAAVAKVDAGATFNWSAKGSLNAKGPLKCTLSQVTRNVSP